MADKPVNIYQALASATQEFGDVKKDNTADTGKFKYKYADLGGVLEAILPALHKHDLILIQPHAIIEGQPIIRSTLIHTPTGEKIESDTPIIWADKGDPQKFGSGITYSRRYGLVSLFSLNVEDDDGSTAQQRPAAQAQSYTERAQKPRGDAVEEMSNTRPSSTNTNPPSTPQMGMMNALVNKVYGQGWEKDPARMEDMKQRLHSLTGVISRTQLTKSTISKYIDWLKEQPEYSGGQGEDYDQGGLPF